MNEPPRLWNDDDASPALRAALRAGREEKAGSVRLASIAAALGAAGIPVAQAAAVSSIAIGAKIAMAVVVVIAGPASFYLSQPSVPAEVRKPDRVAPASIPPPVVEAPVELPPEPSPLVAATVEPRSAGHPPVDVSPLAESQWLESVRQSVSSNPKLALSRLAIYRRRFANPVLAEEAEVLNVDALFALSRNRDAHAAAERFLRQYPSSPHRARLQRLLDDLR